MTEQELSATVQGLEVTMKSMGSDFKQLLQGMAEDREGRHASVSRAAKIDAEHLRKGKTFLGRHGPKLLFAAFTAISSSGAWYGSKIRSEMAAEQRTVAVDLGIKTNATDIEFLDEDVGKLQNESVNLTLMIDKGFRRQDDILVNSGRMAQKDLPDYAPEFKEAVDSAKALKIYNSKYGEKKKKRARAKAKAKADRKAAGIEPETK